MHTLIQYVLIQYLTKISSWCEVELCKLLIHLRVKPLLSCSLQLKCKVISDTSLPEIDDIFLSFQYLAELQWIQSSIGWELSRLQYN